VGHIWIGLLFAALAGAWSEPDGSRTPAVHLIPLYDEEGQKIIPGSGPERPVSFRLTCGDCHSYETIRTGWHFSTNQAPGRPGEPWVLIDEKTSTQLPVSARGWPGTWRPEDVGLTEWGLAKRFGRHSAGGVGEDRADEPDLEARWQVSGPIEVNCLACHNLAREQNMSEWAVQLARENFKWAATAASGLGVVYGMASRLPPTYDFYNGPDPDNTWLLPPQVYYDTSRFDRKSCVLLDLARRVPNSRCYSCHSTFYEGTERVDTDEDVHVAAGMVCTDCHRNRLDHQIVRGYENEDAGQEANPAGALSCRSCHAAGRMGAPVPAHKGMPAVHLDTISCTACHAGPWPGERPGRVRTSRANRLGIHGKACWATDLPYIASPVFLKAAAGVIEPHNVLWPAFWGVLRDEAVSPLPLDVVRPVVDAYFASFEPPESSDVQHPGDEPAIPAPEAAEPVPTEETPENARMAKAHSRIAETDIPLILASLAASGDVDGVPVYVAGGRLHKLDSGKLVHSEHPAAQPYSWALGHDVRSAAQSLGAGGCGDCHSDGAGFFFGVVTPDAPIRLEATPSRPMYALQGYDRNLIEAWDTSIWLRKAYLIGGCIVGVVLALALVRYGYAGLERAARFFVADGRSKTK